MFEKLDHIKKKYEELSLELSKAEVIQNQELFRELAKEHASLEETVQAYDKYLQLKQQAEDLKEMLQTADDPEMVEMIKEEQEDTRKGMENLEQELRTLLLPKDPNDDKNVILEIRAGTGGE